MIIVNNDLKICSILDNFLTDPYASHSTAMELFRTILYDSLKDIAGFKKENERPIRTATSLSTIKRMITPGTEVFHTITPFGVMNAQETKDENLGALITPVGTWNPIIPYALNTTPVYSHMKTFDVKNNVEIRLGYASANYTVGLTLYDSTRPQVFNTSHKWDFMLIPGTVYRRMVNMKVIVPRMLIAEYCNWSGVDLDFTWFIKEMNKKSEEAFKFSIELDTGTGKWEVMLSYATTLTFRGASSGEPMSEEEGDTVKYWYFQRAFLMSINLPTHFIFGRESDKRFDIGGDKVYMLDTDTVSYGKTNTLKGVKEDLIGEGNIGIRINTDDLIDGYEMVEKYVVSDEELDVMNDLELLEVSVFGDIVINEEPIKYKFLEYCIEKKLLDGLEKPILVCIKSDNINLEVTNRLDEGLFISCTNALDTILKDRNCCIYVYFKNSLYRNFVHDILEVVERPTANFNIKQTT